MGGGIVDDGVYSFGFVPAGPSGCTADDDTSSFDHCSAIGGYSTAIGHHVLTVTAYDEAGNGEFHSIEYDVDPWDLQGFHHPVDMFSYNVARGGSTVPLKFEIFAGTMELTSTSDVDSFTQQQVACGIW
ncbi:MAG: PxKF domain-containing protein, partial [Gammaproteobacteria bacterium]